MLGIQNITAHRHWTFWRIQFVFASVATMKTASVFWVVLLWHGHSTLAFPFPIRSSRSAHFPRVMDIHPHDTGRSSSLWTRAMSEKAAANASEMVPASISSAPFNFGPASSRDDVLYTCHCPGYTGKEEGILVAEQKKRIDSWLDFMKQKQGITQVIALLDDNELILPNGEVNHEGPVDLRDVYSVAQIPFLIQPMRDVNAYRTIMECIDTVASQGGKVVVHCTGGVGRAGRVASGWMVHRYGCTPAEATNEVLEEAAKHGVNRRGTAEQLQSWIDACQPNVEGCCD